MAGARLSFLRHSRSLAKALRRELSLWDLGSQKENDWLPGGGAEWRQDAGPARYETNRAIDTQRQLDVDASLLAVAVRA